MSRDSNIGRATDAGLGSRLTAWQSAIRRRRNTAAADRAQARLWQWGYAVLRAWPDGSHDLTVFSPHKSTALHRARADIHWWQRTPAARPVLWVLVEATRAEVEEHSTATGYHGCTRRACRHTDTSVTHLMHAGHL